MHHEIDREAHHVFELHDLKAPKLSGLSLTLFSTLLDYPILGYPLRKSILRTSGFEAFRHRAVHHLPHSPSIQLPLHFPQPHPPAADPTITAINVLYEALYPSQEARPQRRPSIRDYHDAFRNHRTTPIKVAHVILEQIKRFNQSPYNLNAVIRINEQQTLRHAEASTNRWHHGTPLSVLDGVPFSVKDMLDVVGYSTRCASTFEESDINHDADVVTALREAGMLLIGKCNQDELGIGVRGFSVHTGQTRNPYHVDYVPGGSSAGSAVSVATGLCPVSIATDAGGSVRIPAACNGIFGIKPTFARISTHGRVLTHRDDKDEVSSCLHVGVLASYAEDLALIYHLMAAFAPHRRIPDHDEFQKIPQEIPAAIDMSMSGLRVGICRPWLESSPECGRSAARQVLSHLERAGAVQVPVAIPNLEDIRVSLPIGLMRAAIRALDRAGVYGNGKGGDIGCDPRSKLVMGCEFTESDETHANHVRAKAIAHANEMFKNIDILLLPALGCEVPRVPGNLHTGVVDVGTDSRMMRFMLYANFTGLPACVMPVSKESSGIPCGAQAIAKPWDEQILLKICLWAQKEFGIFPPPSLSCNPLEQKNDDMPDG